MAKSETAYVEKNFADRLRMARPRLALYDGLRAACQILPEVWQDGVCVV